MRVDLAFEIMQLRNLQPTPSLQALALVSFSLFQSESCLPTTATAMVIRMSRNENEIKKVMFCVNGGKSSTRNPGKYPKARVRTVVIQTARAKKTVANLRIKGK